MSRHLSLSLLQEPYMSSKAVRRHDSCVEFGAV